MLSEPLTAMLSSVISVPSQFQHPVFPWILPGTICAQFPLSIFLECVILGSEVKRNCYNKEEVTKGIKNKRCFCDSLVWSLMGDNESICEGFMEGNKRVRCSIILTQTSVLSSDTGRSWNATWPFEHFSRNELYCCHQEIT